MKPLTFVQRIAYVLASDLTGLRFITLPLYLIAAIGFVLQVGSDVEHEINYLLGLAPWYVWTFGFSSVCIVRSIGMFTDFQINYTNYWRVGTAFVGIVMWGFTLASISKSGSINSMNILYSVPCLIEMWLLGRAFDKLIHGDMTHG